MLDRGTKKWTSLMLPEHVSMIRQLWVEDDYKQKPILSDQQLEENQFTLEKVINSNAFTEIKYFENHEYHLIRGKISLVSDHLIINEKRIKLSDIIQIKII